MTPRGRAAFWEALESLVAQHPLTIDRPRGSAHPRFPDLIYPLDYGFLEGTRSSDGAGLDVFVGSRPERRLDALLVTIDLAKGDSEPKLLLGCTEAEQTAVLEVLNRHEMHALLIRRGPPGLELLATRRSVRRFQPRPIPPEMIEQILAAATWAPSAHNMQPWRFVVVQSQEARQRLADGMGADFRRDMLRDGMPPTEAETQARRSHLRILEAPLLVILCQDITVGDAYPDPGRQQAEMLMGAQGVAMAGDTLLLAAHGLGLGGVWSCAPLFTPEAARRALDLPESWHPQAMLMIGYPARDPDRRPRQPLETVTRYV
jgi:F420 biosynthesis protein FbiB-like protein